MDELLELGELTPDDIPEESERALDELLELGELTPDDIPEESERALDELLELRDLPSGDLKLCELSSDDCLKFPK